MELIKALVIALKLDEATQSPLIVGFVVVMFAWIVYSKAQQAIKEDRNRVRSVYQELYSPALAMLRLKSGGRITSDQFQTKFADLLIAQGAKANPECVKEIDQWLQGEQNEAEIEYCVEEACASARRTLKRQASIWATVWWLFETQDRIVKLLLAVGVVAIGLSAFVYVVERHYGKVLACLFVLTVAAQAFRDWRKARAVSTRQERVAQIRARRRLSSVEAPHERL